MKEVEALTRRFTTEISVLIGPDRDIPAPDVNTNAQTMAWMMDTYSMHAGYTVPGVVTGKPIELGGSLGRREATGRGVAFALDAATKAIGGTLDGARIVLQGFGNVGMYFADIVRHYGAKIIAIGDVYGAIEAPDGVDIDAAMAWAARTGSIKGLPGAAPLDSARLLELDCDILVPAAMEGQITARNADAIKATIVAEAANGPTTPEADEILSRKGVFIVPDILANAGGVTVSYSSRVQDLNRDQWSEEVVNTKLKEIMDRSFAEVLDMSRRESVNMRTAAYLVAVQRVANSTALRGLYP